MLWYHNARVNSHQRWKQTRFRVCFHLWCELTRTTNVTEWQVSWNSYQGLKRGSRARYLFREDRQTIVWDVISTIEMWSPPGKRVISAFHWLSMSLKLFAWNPPGILVRAGQNEVISEACPSLSSKGLSWAIHHGQCMQPEKTIKRARAIPRKNPQSHPCHDCWTCGQRHLPHITQPPVG